MTEQWSLAIPLLERVGKTSPNDPDVLYELTSCRVRLGNYEDALASASRFANLPGYEARGHVFVAAILRDLGKDNEAVAAYQAALEHDPKAEKMQVPPAQFYLLYGQTLLKLGRAEDALEPLKRSASARETPEVLLELGNAALQLQRLEDAKTAWKRAVQIDPRHAEARESLARAELQQGRAQQAIEWLAPLPDDSLTVETAYLRQRAYTLLKNDELARQWQERTNQLRKQQQLNAGVNDIVRDSPQSFWAQVVRTYRFAQQGNWRQAELMSERLIREAPAEPFVIELSAAVHRRRDLPSLESFPMNRH
jgi:tetratricopeptide (TPR) repeat protein